MDRGVGTTAAGTAMAVPLFIQKTAAGCYSCCEVRLRSAEELDRVVAARSTLTNKRPYVRAYVTYNYVYAHVCTRMRDRDYQPRLV